jgi:hypothetical protein
MKVNHITEHPVEQIPSLVRRRNNWRDRVTIEEKSTGLRARRHAALFSATKVLTACARPEELTLRRCADSNQHALGIRSLAKGLDH